MGSRLEIRPCQALWGLVLGLGLATAAQAGGRICFEAESAAPVTAPMRVTGGDQPLPADAKEAAVWAAASGKAFLEVPEGVGKPPEVGGEATCTFAVKEGGVYYLWCRVWWLDGCGNSVTLHVDGGQGIAFGQDGTYKTWHWVKAPSKPVLDLAPGRHTLKLANREDGVRIDQVLLVQEKRYVPVDVEAVTPPPAGP